MSGSSSPRTTGHLWVDIHSHRLGPGPSPRLQAGLQEIQAHARGPSAEAEDDLAAPPERAAPLKATSSGLLKRKKVASSSKRPTSPKSAAGPALPAADETEE